MTSEGQQLIVLQESVNIPACNLIVEGIHYNHVREHNKRLYNSNNHWPLEQKPVNYDATIAKCNLTEWVTEFRQPGTYTIVDIPIKSWILESNKLGQQTGELSLLYYEDLQDYCARYEQDPTYTKLFTPEALAKVGGGYFVRSNSVSLKNGIHGVGPYTNLRKIIESLITCNAGHNPMSDYQPETRTLRLYLFPWLDIQDEYRVFVHNRRVTAISQQDLGTPHPVMAQTDKPSKYARIVTEKILAEFARSVQPWLERTGRDSVTIDMALLGPTLDAYVVEFNPFGPEQAAGSSLFHWELNWDKLSAPASETVYFRFTTI